MTDTIGTPLNLGLTRRDIIDNPAQGMDRYPRTLCVCSGGILRSPTLAWVLSNPPYDRNTRSAGSSPEFALVAVDDVLLDWADEVVIATPANYRAVLALYPDLAQHPNVYVLNVPDEFEYRDPALLRQIASDLRRVGFPIFDNNKPTEETRT